MSYQENAKFSVDGNLVMSLMGDRVTAFGLVEYVQHRVVSFLFVLG